MKMPKLNFKVLFDNDKFLWFLSFLFAFMLWFTVVNTIDTTAGPLHYQCPGVL